MSCLTLPSISVVTEGFDNGCNNTNYSCVATKPQCENITLPLAAVQVVLFTVFICRRCSETNPQMLPFLELEKVRSNL